MKLKIYQYKNYTCQFCLSVKNIIQQTKSTFVQYFIFVCLFLKMIKFFLKFLISSITNNFKMIFLSQFKPKNLHSFYFSQCDEHVIAYQQCMGHVNWRNTLNANIITSRENGKCIEVYIYI